MSACQRDPLDDAGDGAGVGGLEPLVGTGPIPDHRQTDISFVPENPMTRMAEERTRIPSDRGRSGGATRHHQW